MKTAIVTLLVALSAPGLVVAQSSDMKSMASHGAMDHASNDAKVITHKAVGVVQKIDRNNGTVTLAHEAVQSLNWPPMTMAFAVKPKGLLDKFAVGKKVNVEFVGRGKDYVVTAVK